MIAGRESRGPRKGNAGQRLILQDEAIMADETPPISRGGGVPSNGRGEGEMDGGMPEEGGEEPSCLLLPPPPSTSLSLTLSSEAGSNVFTGNGWGVWGK